MGLPIPWESPRLVRDAENLHGFLLKKDSPQPLSCFPSLAQTHFHLPYDGHGVQIGRLP